MIKTIQGIAIAYIIFATMLIIGATSVIDDYKDVITKYCPDMTAKQFLNNNNK